MTSSLKVQAHCGEEIEVRVLCVKDGDIKEIHRLNDGEEYECAVYDNQEFRVQEIKKKNWPPKETTA